MAKGPHICGSQSICLGPFLNMKLRYLNQDGGDTACCKLPNSMVMIIITVIIITIIIIITILWLNHSHVLVQAQYTNGETR